MNPAQVHAAGMLLDQLRGTRDVIRRLKLAVATHATGLNHRLNITFDKSTIALVELPVLRGLSLMESLERDLVKDLAALGVEVDETAEA